MRLKRSPLFLLSLPIISCMTTETDRREENTLSLAPRMAMDAGLVDEPLQRVTRQFNSTVGDHMDMTVEANVAGYAFEGATWYVLPATGTTTEPTLPIYRLFHPTYSNHIMSTSTNEGGYTNEFQIGRLLANPDPELALQPVRRFRREWNEGSTYRVDHMTARYDETPSGYVLDGTLGYGWPASNNVGTIDEVVKDGITIGLSRNWGGSIVRFRVGSNPEYVNRFDAGREIQSAMWYSGSDNPTEGGTNAQTTPVSGNCFCNGSPVINYDLNRLGPGQPNTPGALYTRTSAFRFEEGTSSLESPILSGTEISKTVQIVNANRIQYVTRFRHAKSPTVTTYPFPMHEPLTAYLNDGAFDRIRLYRWNGTAWERPAGWTDIDANVNSATNIVTYFQPTSTNAHLIMAVNTTSAQAFALFARNPVVRAAGSTRGTELGYYRHLTASSGGGPTMNPTLKLTITETGVPFTQGQESSYTNHILVGTVAQVLAQANLLR